MLCALLFGSVVKAMTDLIADAGSPATAMIGVRRVDALLSLLVLMIAMVTTIFALQSAASLRTDEASGIIEPQLAGAVSRTRWVAQRLLIPAIGSAVLLLVGGACMGAGYGALIGDPGRAADWRFASLAYWPAVMVLVGVAVALFGWLPRLAVPAHVGGAVRMWSIVIVGDALHLPGWLLDALPFSATPHLPLAPLTWTPLVIMTLIAAGLVWAGVDRFTRRDVIPAASAAAWRDRPPRAPWTGKPSCARAAGWRAPRAGCPLRR